MLKLIQDLIEQLNASGLTYCHWKSNMGLAAALEGQTDIDLLIREDDARPFRSVLGRLGFRPAQIDDDDPFPLMEHYFGLDEQSGTLVHVHAYYGVVTGESLAKNYRLPIEQMLFENRREQEGVQVPTKSAELVVFTIRMMLKHTSLVELLLLARDWKTVKREAVWLTETGSMGETIRLVEQWLPSVDSALFAKCARALKKPGPLLGRVILGLRLRSQLGAYARQSAMRSSLSGLRKFSTMLVRRLTGSRKGMKLQPRGAVIAFVGPEATGKSTLLAEVRSWLGEHFVVEQIHAGKPKSTILSVAPNLLLPALRSILPKYRSGHVEEEYTAEQGSGNSRRVYPLIFAVRSVLLAYDRRSLLTNACARAAKGTIVLCDRYPSTADGATDSPQLSQFDIPWRRSPVRNLLARTEKRLYQDIPAPDLVIALTVPLEVAIARNKNRGKYEPEDFVRRRHAQSSRLVFENAPVFRVSTDQPLDQTVSAIKKVIWQGM